MTDFSCNSPQVSVVMVCHGAAGDVRRSIASILNQSLQNFELLVVACKADAETERLLTTTAERELRLSWWQCDDTRPSQALLQAIERARAPYIFIAEKNGVAEADALRLMVAAATEDKLDLVIGGFAAELLGGTSTKTWELAASRGFMAPLSVEEFRQRAWELLRVGQLLPTTAKLVARPIVLDCALAMDEAVLSRHAHTLAWLRQVERVGVLGGVLYRVGPCRAVPTLEAVETALSNEYEALCALAGEWHCEEQALPVLRRRYFEQVRCLIDVVVRISAMERKERDERIARVLALPQTQEAAAGIEPQITDVRDHALLAAIRSQSVPLAVTESQLTGLLPVRIGGCPPIDLLV